jgi:hypothetical protein
MRGVLALLAALVGAVAGAAGMSFLLAEIFTAIDGPFEGAAAMGGFTVGMPLGGIIGAGVGLWLVLRQKAPSNGRLLAWLAGAVAVLIVIGAIVWENA